MIDLHTHTIWSDGELVPAELLRRALVSGYRAIGMTDHVDASNMKEVISALREAARAYGGRSDIRMIPGVELTHVPPELIPDAIAEARALGARIVVVHGETLVEPVAPGTNSAAIAGRCDILAHPGLLNSEDAEQAARNGVYLEISARKGHCLANGHVATMARRTGARMILNTDAHSPGDLISLDQGMRILAGAGLDADEVRGVLSNSEAVLSRLDT